MKNSHLLLTFKKFANHTRRRRFTSTISNSRAFMKTRLPKALAFRFGPIVAVFVSLYSISTGFYK
uniref:Uncharacterized protein n=1 Tax=Cannabis sativa TaxID=3483 RepID=A0A803R4F3_CANSA